MPDPVTAILEHMDAHPGTSANQAAEALGLPKKHATAARKKRRGDASRARPRASSGKVVHLAEQPKPFDPVTCTEIEFLEHEVRECFRLCEDAIANGAWTVSGTYRRLGQERRAQLDAARAALPPKKQTESDADLVRRLEQLLEGLPDQQRPKQLTG